MTRRGLGMLLALVLLAGLVGSAWAQALPRSVTFGTNTPGTVFYAVASGLAKVVTDSTPMQMTVQPYTGTSTFLPLLNAGELDFGIINAVDLGMAYQGPQRLKVGGRNVFPHSPQVRLVLRGGPLMFAFLVRKDSPIKTVADIKGKRLTGEYPAHLAVWTVMYAALTGAGLSWNDVKVVPVPAVNDGVDALVQGRADVTGCALNAAKIREADTAVGVRHLAVDCSAESERRTRQAVPGFYHRIVKTGGAVAVVEDTGVLAYDVYVTTHRGASEHVVAALLKAVWDSMDKLGPFHPTFKEWTRERAAAGDATIPYHPAAIKFYKDQGLWKPEMDQMQQKLLALNP